MYDNYKDSIIITNTHSRQTRFSSNSNLTIPYSRTNADRFRIQTTGAKIFNSLPIDIKTAKTSSIFLNKLKHWLKTDERDLFIYYTHEYLFKKR